MDVLPPPATSEKKPSNIVYGLEDRIPLGPSITGGLQHVSAMVVGTITPPLILAGILKFSEADTAYLRQHCSAGLGARYLPPMPAAWAGRIRIAECHQAQASPFCNR